MRPSAHVESELELPEIDESMERALFARRARTAACAPPPFADVLAAVARDERAAHARARRIVPRAALGALAIAASVAAIFSGARAMTPPHDRVADHGDASAPALTNDEAVVCVADRSALESRDDRCVAAPAPLASYAALDQALCSIE